MKHNQAREERIRWFSKGNRTQKNRTRDIGPSSAAVDMPESYHQQLILRCVSCRTGPVLMDAYLAEMQHRWNTHISRQNIPCHTDMKLMQWRRPDENGKYKQADDVWMERECLQHVVGLSIFEKGPSVFSTYLRRYEKSRSSELSEFVDLGDRPRELHQYLVNGPKLRILRYFRLQKFKRLLQRELKMLKRHQLCYMFPGVHMRLSMG
jgi:hypothetical protein